MDRELECYQRFLAGDPEGLEDLVGCCRDGLTLYLNGFVGNLHTAEELTEEVFVKLVLKRPRFSRRSAFKTWLYAIGRNLAIDHLRRQTRQPLSLEEGSQIREEEASLEHSYIRREDKLQLHRCMKQLKPEYRQVLWLAYFEAFSYQQIAHVMRKTTHGIETLAYRARLALKNILLKEGFEYEDQ